MLSIWYCLCFFFSYYFICLFHLYFFFFFFYLSGAHRDLPVLTPAFPPRRSSDLQPARLPEDGIGGGGPGDVGPHRPDARGHRRGPALRRLHLPDDRLARGPGPVRRGRGRALRGGGRPDRPRR